MRRSMAVAALILLAGCESMPRHEMVFHAIHAIDVMQTVNGPARDDCYTEAAPVTQALIGENPSVSGVLLWGVSVSALHYGASRYLEGRHPKTYAALQALTIGSSANAVRRNHAAGIRPWGSNKRDCSVWQPVPWVEQ